jgi:hypothetical protein
MRMTASWSGSDRTYRIQVGGAKMRLNGKLPSNHHSDRRRQTLELRRKARLPVHPPSACSGLKALRNTSLAKAASRQAALAFRSLDPFRALREPDPRRRDEERPSRSEQRTLSKNQKQRLDRKSPIQVRILDPTALATCLLRAMRPRLRSPAEAPATVMTSSIVGALSMIWPVPANGTRVCPSASMRTSSRTGAPAAMRSISLPP